MVLWSERIIVALPEDHPLAANEIIYWTDLKHERFLLSERDPGPEIQDILVAKLSSPGDLPDVVRHDVSPENVKSLVGAGRGPAADRRSGQERIIAESIASYPGNCPCPYNLASNGSHCGKRSAWSKPGGYEPICYPDEISPAMVAAWKLEQVR